MKMNRKQEQFNEDYKEEGSINLLISQFNYKIKLKFYYKNNKIIAIQNLLTSYLNPHTLMQIKGEIKQLTFK